MTKINFAHNSIVRRLFTPPFVLIILFAVSSTFAQQATPQRSITANTPEESSRASQQVNQANAARNKIEDNLVVTHHTGRIGGKVMRYTATTGTLVLRKEDGAPRANMFFIAYTRDDASGETANDKKKRPVMFTFNGGPGSSSVWLHLGAFGPVKVVTDKDGNPTAPPFKLEENGYSVLDQTDLVFIDPVGTGYSRAVAGEDPKQFYGFNGDIESVGEFIRLYATKFERWGSPKFLAGESYGTMRAAALSGYLQNRFGMYLNGIVLVSSVIDFGTIRFAPNNLMPYLLYFPSYTATAWYHKRLPSDLQASLPAALREAENFAMNDYAKALMRGDSLPPNERAEIARKVARLTGLSPAYIEQANLILSQARFGKELLRAERRTVGRLDSRFKGIDSDAAGEDTEYDSSYAVIQGIYSTLFNDYVRSELKYENDIPYEILTGRVQPWSYANSENRYLSAAETLRAAMSQNPALRVFVASGYYDLATPYFATTHTFDRMGLDASQRANLQFEFYESGHMLYMHQPSLAKMRGDLESFLRQAAGR